MRSSRTVSWFNEKRNMACLQVCNMFIAHLTVVIVMLKVDKFELLIYSVSLRFSHMILWYICLNTSLFFQQIYT